MQLTLPMRCGKCGILLYILSFQLHNIALIVFAIGKYQSVKILMAIIFIGGLKQVYKNLILELLFKCKIQQIMMQWNPALQKPLKYERPL